MTVQELFSSRAHQLEVVGEAGCAPSIHNVQPGRVVFAAPDGVLICAVSNLALPAADPSGHDRLVSLGCLTEGLSLALKKRGLYLQPTEDSSAPSLLPEGYELISKHRVALDESAKIDELGLLTQKRQSYRGAFTKQGDIGLVRRLAKADPHVLILSDRKAIVEIAALHDQASLHFMRQRPYLKELYHWMRFSKNDPRFSLDGLNAEAMALSGFEAFAASCALHPGIFQVLDKLRLGGSLISEKSQSISSLGMMIFKAKEDENPLQVGRRFYRAWLRLTAAGVAACPMTSSIDNETTRRELEKFADLQSKEKIVNLLRFGITPKGYKFYSRARLKAEDLLLQI